MGSHIIGAVSKRFATSATLAVVSILGSVLLAGCGKSDPLLNPDPLAPFIQARYRVEGAVATFKQEFQPINQTDTLSSADWNKYKRGRQLYNQAAASVNGLIVQIMLANQARSEVPEAQLKQQLSQAIQQAVEFQEYAEAARREAPLRSSSTSPAIAAFDIPLTPIAIPSLIDAAFGQIRSALQQVRSAEQDKRDKLEALLRGLLLPSFDEAGKVPDGTPQPPRMRPQAPAGNRLNPE